MRRPHTLLAALLLAAGTAAAQDYGQAATLKIWDNTTAPHSNGIATPEREPEPNRIADVSQAVLYIFPADPAKATGQAVVICPGGGYVKLCIDYEGYDMAKWFAANGITAAVLKYRMPNGHPEVPLEDVEQALRIMMGLEAGATGFTAGKVGIVGSSAGGHLAASASTLAETKPAFSILFYPVITAEKGKGHQGSFNALLGDKLTERQMLTLATAIEGHPDNVAPAMLGGFVTSVIDEGQVYSVKKDIDPELAFAAFVPDFRLLTSKARAALPAMVSHKDAVYNLSRAALATAAFCEGNYALLGVATKDVLHQKYRLPLIEGGDDVFELAQDLGAQAVYISGAGPTIMAVVHKDDIEFFTRAEAALAADSPLRHFTVHRLLADNVGAVVS